MSIAAKQQEVLEEFAFFQDSQERYEYLISLGKKLPPMDESLRTTDRLIKGCQAQVWLDARAEEGVIRYVADSDSVITKGMIAIFVRVLDDEPADAVLTADLSFLKEIKLDGLLTSTRANALNLMATQMKKCALELSAS